MHPRARGAPASTGLRFARRADRALRPPAAHPRGGRPTELTLKPPYDADLLVEVSSAARYDRAFLTVRVPASLGEPLTRADLESSLWEGVTVSARVRCGAAGSYVAERLAASPPL